ncbi:hypothetical protein K443DRAFT_117359, partial [Laccaria amethystina LaAM-08-1]
TLQSLLIDYKRLQKLDLHYKTTIHRPSTRKVCSVRFLETTKVCSVCFLRLQKFVVCFSDM